MRRSAVGVDNSGMDSRVVVIALPGFTRTPAHLHRLAQACASRGWVCCRPTLASRWIPANYMQPSRIRRVAERLAPELLNARVVVAGHSAGAASGTLMALDLMERGVDVRGLVYIDGVDSPKRLIRCYLPRLMNLRIAAVLAPPSSCNRKGALGHYLADFPSVRIDTVAGAGHGAIEGVGVGPYRRFCDDRTTEVIADVFLAKVLQGIDWASGRD